LKPIPVHFTLTKTHVLELLPMLHCHLSVSISVCIGLNMDNSHVLLQYLEKGFRHPQPLNCPREMYEIMLICWKKTPEERPTFQYLFNTMDDYNVSEACSSYAET